VTHVARQLCFSAVSGVTLLLSKRDKRPDKFDLFDLPMTSQVTEKANLVFVGIVLRRAIEWRLNSFDRTVRTGDTAAGKIYPPSGRVRWSASSPRGLRDS